MKIISERGFPQDDYDDFDDTPEENTEKTCLHPCVFRGKCVSCETVALKYVHQGMWLWLSNDEMDRIRKVESAKLLEDKKMVLVLDVDQTLVHSTEQEKYLKTPQELLQHELRDSLFRLSRPWERMMLKLRPVVHTFLKEASTMFEIYMCTTSTRSYALKATEFLDPKNVYFMSSRIIAREDLLEIEEKSLDLVLKEERMVLILDQAPIEHQLNQARFIVRPSLKSINSPHEPPKPVSVPEASNKLRGETIEVNEESLDSVLRIA